MTRLRILVLLLVASLAVAGVGNIVKESNGVHWFPDGIMGAMFDTTNEVNVRSPVWGAIGDGVTDDTTAIKAALDSKTSRRGAFYFPAGTYKITDSLVWSQVDPNPSSHIGAGATIRGAGRDLTVIDYTGSGCPFVFNDLRGTVGGNVALISLRDMTIKVSSGACGILITDPAQELHFENLRLWGNTAATGIISRGQISCACHSSFRNIQLRNWFRGIWLSGFSNAEELTQFECLVATKTCYDVSALIDNSICAGSGTPLSTCTGDGTGTGANGPVCWASGKPYACCTGAGTGDGTGACAADSLGGSDNLLSRLEASSGVGLGWNFSSTAARNICVKCVADGATASATVGVGQTFISAVLNPDPTGNGVGLSHMIGTAYSGNDSTVDDDQVPGKVIVTTNSGGATRSMRIRMNTANPFYQIEAAAGGNGDRFQWTGSSGATSTMEVKVGGIIGLTVDGNGETTIAGISGDGAGKVACVKADGTVGSCTSAVGAGGTCTCS